jgi:DNA-directed RNA polymerase subunit RPC12/RpoP
MLPGPDIIYKCPKCGVFLKRGSLMSGNTFGAQLYSDGKRIAPMSPDFPNLTKCKKCDSIFWLSDLDIIGESEWGDTSHPKWEYADEVEFLCIKDLIRALETVKDQDEEELINMWICQAFNDRARNSVNDFFKKIEMKDARIENERIKSAFFDGIEKGDIVIKHEEGKLYPWADVLACKDNSLDDSFDDSFELNIYHCPHCSHETFWIYFRSPARTWKGLCGTAGYMLICPYCIKQIWYEERVMN